MTTTKLITSNTMTTTVSQPSLWEEQEQPCEEASHSIKVIYFGGRREVYRVGSPEWEEVARDMSVWSAEFVRVPCDGKLAK